MTNMTNMTGMTARQLIKYIANDYIELSHDRVRGQRDYYIRLCREWLERNKE